MSSFANLLVTKEVVVCCGPGGVGKTTIAAAAAAAAAWRFGLKVLVITVDPARRLADAMGLELLDNTETEVDLGDPLVAGGKLEGGRLWAAMVNPRRGWDDLIRRHSPDPSTAARILANPLYQEIAERFVQSHDYIAMEMLYEIHSRGAYDLIVVDTPPSRNAIDLLEAPARMGEFFSSRWLRWLTLPARSGFLAAAAKPFTLVGNRVLGPQFLGDVSEFFGLLQGMYEGFVARSAAVGELLASDRTSFAVVTTCDASAIRETGYFLKELARRNLPTGALIFNKVLPAALRDRSALAAAARMGSDAVALAEELGEGRAGARVLGEVAANFDRYGVVAKRHHEARVGLAGRTGIVTEVGYLDHDIADLQGLGRVGRSLLAEGPDRR